ncbi:hypothetical protein FUAX_09640 [Fulvitalea axinellae]|uniref:Uncharacterized protein n=1 Tax=Fulvitalea axinellae TaxID=1182444 RepID=A0AAU9CKT2_9BACT|nr:hypothetical protein FUAX_09640 [Fulvitalea axinellae]
MEWYYTFGLFLLMIFLRFIVNFYKYKRISKLKNAYINYLGLNNYSLAEDKEEIKSLFREAGLKDSSVFHQELLGFGKYANVRISVLDNLTNRREDIVGNVLLKFDEAIGVYRKRFRESFNPIFWIEFIVKLPQYIMQFLGVLPEKISVKIFLIIYWLIAILFGLKKFDLLQFLVKK